MTAINLSTWCRRCGAEFTADRASVISGTWRYCERCRADPGDPTPPRPARPTAGNP